MKILFAGGGSGGPVAPLLAIAAEIKKEHPKAKFLLVGTKSGPERLMAAQAKIPFEAIPAGKWRRYFSVANAGTPFLVLAGFLRSFLLLKKFRPDCVIGSGSFVQIPVVYAAWILRIPVVLHQQDVQQSLANTVCQFFAKKITVTFEKSLTDFIRDAGLFYKKKPDKIIWTGNPCRFEAKNFTRSEGLKHFGLKEDLPVLYAVGGGTGAVFINGLIRASLPDLAKTVQIIHSTGPGKYMITGLNYPNYHPKEFVNEAGLAYAAADIVLCRAGLSTITELSEFKKTAVIIPMPGSHQEINAALLAERRAAIVLPQQKIKPENFAGFIRKLLFEPTLPEALQKNITGLMPKNSGKKIAAIVLKIIQEHNERNL